MKSACVIQEVIQWLDNHNALFIENVNVSFCKSASFVMI